MHSLKKTASTLIGLSALFYLGSNPVASAPKKYEQIDQLFYAYKQGVRPGYAIGITRSGKLEFAKGYGYSNLERKLKINADTSFNLASLSKQFTGAIVAQTMQKKQLSLEDNLSQHWSNLPSFMASIRIDHLVYMTSGLTDYYNLPSPKGGWLSENEFTVDDAIKAVFTSNKLEYPPGTRWTYSNINYQLLADTVAKKQFKTFSQLSDEWLFKPLEMGHTWVDTPIDNSREYKAVSYEGNRFFGWKEAPRLSPHYGGSGVFSSLNDLAKWQAALYHQKSFGEEFTEIMLATRKFNHDKTNDALGLVHGDYQGVNTIWYSGSDYGVSTYIVHLPEKQQSVICLANFADGDCGAKVRAILDILLL